MSPLLPAPLARRLTELLGDTPEGCRLQGGGCINDAVGFRAGGASFFVKYNRDAPPGFFEAEAAGLKLLADAEAIATPRVVAVGGGAAPDPCPAFLLMEHFGDGVAGSGFGRALGEGLAALHRVGPTGTIEVRGNERGDQVRFGLQDDNFIGALPQRNTWTGRWPTFFAERRIGFQQELARRRDCLSSRAHEALDRIRSRIDALIPDATPSLLHGDLWSGNFGCRTDGAPVVFDPAVYFGDREIELAFTELFGGFPSGFRAAYEACLPLEPGYAERRDLYNLYPLLVHANLFGGGYGAQVERVATRYA